MIALRAMKSITFSEKKNQTIKASSGRDINEISLKLYLCLYDINKNNEPNINGHIWVSLELVPKFTHGRKAKNIKIRPAA